MINIQNLENIYEQRYIKRKKSIIKCAKIAAFVVIAPIIAYLFGSFAFADFNPENWTQNGRINILWIAIVIWWLSLFPLTFSW